MHCLVSKARSVVFDKESKHIFVLERGTESIIYLFDGDGDGFPETKQVVASAASLNHGLAIHDGYIYASSDSTVFRWPYNSTQDSFPLQAQAEEIVTNINEDGMGGAPQGHRTRTIVFDESGTMYISVGSNANIDPDSYRSRIRRFVDISSATDLPLDFQTMEVFADGLRNEVGMAFDRHGILWGVENSADNLNRDDLGGDIHEDNPSEELNRFDPREFDASSQAKHYGYPYCWTEYNLPQPFGKGRGTQWVWPSFHEDFGGTLTDADCLQYEAPVLALQGHSAPLGIIFYEWKPPEELDESCNGSFPSSMDGFAFIAYHGSWNRDVPTGYKVVYVEMDADGNPISNEPIDLLAHQAPNAKWEDGFRPVDVAFDACGRLLVTSDGTRGVGSKIVRIDYQGVVPAFSSSYSRSFEPSIFLCLLWVFLTVVR